MEEQAIKTISILGSGWLGLPLAESLAGAGFQIKISTTSEDRLPLLAETGASAFLINTAQLSDNIQDFLSADTLIVNIPSKDVSGFNQLIQALERSSIKQVLFISSTSVYKDANKALLETDIADLKPCPLLEIEQLFMSNTGFKTTVLRFSGLMGYNRHPGRFFRSGKAVSNAQAPVNMIHRDDCIGIIKQIIQQGAWGDVFNACADTHPLRGEFYTHMARLAGEPEPQVINNEISSFKLISNQKVKVQLGYPFCYPDVMKIYS